MRAEKRLQTLNRRARSDAPYLAWLRRIGTSLSLRRSDSQIVTMNPNEMAFVALGSNLGDSRALVCAAMDRLQQFSDFPIHRSSLWESAPVNCPPGSPSFINAAVGFVPRPNETPETLLGKLQPIEREFGRTPKTVLNEARPLDLDLITFRREIRKTSELTLPHPRAHLRRFVLAPLNEIAPRLLLPGTGKTVRALLSHLKSEEFVKKII